MADSPQLFENGGRKAGGDDRDILQSMTVERQREKKGTEGEFHMSRPNVDKNSPRKPRGR